MKMRSESRRALALLAIALLLVALALTLGAGYARASDGGMSGMPGMTDEEMQQMGQTPARRPAPAGRRLRKPPVTKRRPRRART